MHPASQQIPGCGGIPCSVQLASFPSPPSDDSCFAAAVFCLAACTPHAASTLVIMMCRLHAQLASYREHVSREHDAAASIPGLSATVLLNILQELSQRSRLAWYASPGRLQLM